MSGNDDPSSGPDEIHLVRSAEVDGIRSLAPLTDMERLHFSEIRLAAGEGADLGAPGAELFVYVIGGRGRVQSAGETADIAAGDFLSATDILSISNPFAEKLICISGGENS
jgi:hypothetical protein